MRLRPPSIKPVWLNRLRQGCSVNSRLVAWTARIRVKYNNLLKLTISINLPTIIFANFPLFSRSRYIYVCHPIMARDWCTISKVSKAILLLALLAFAHQFTRFFDRNFQDVSVSESRSCFRSSSLFCFTLFFIFGAGHHRVTSEYTDARRSCTWLLICREYIRNESFVCRTAILSKAKYRTVSMLHPERHLYDKFIFWPLQFGRLFLLNF